MKSLEDIDKNCVPFKRRRLYLVTLIPLLLLMGLIFVYLWMISPILGLIYILFYLGACFFQAYCCAYQECPYIGNFCPGIFGIIPSSRIAQFEFIRNVKKSGRLFELFAAIAFIMVLSMIFFPLIWLNQLGFFVTIGYLGFNILYFMIFLWVICPNCAIRNTCPAGRISNAVQSFR
ncbi:MAG: hypothetical protein ACXABI_05925 [Candidatus Hodarchaeales archaeon]|jgi:hypothetical protein